MYEDSSPSIICQLETRSRCHLQRCSDPGLVHSGRFRLSSFSLISAALKKISQEEADLVLNPVWQAQPWWPALLDLLIKIPCHEPHLQTPAEGFCISSKNPPDVPQAPFSHLSHEVTTPSRGLFRRHCKNNSLSHLHLHK